MSDKNRFVKFDPEIWHEKCARNPRFISVWSFLLSAVSYKKQSTRLFGYKVELPAGVFDGTVREIAAKTGVHRSSVFRILRRLKNLGLIEFETVENWFVDDGPVKHGDLIRNKINRNLINVKNYKVIRVLERKQLPEFAVIDNGFRTRIDNVLKCYKHKLKLNDVLDFLQEFKKTNKITDDRIIRNLAYTLAKPRRSFFPYLQKALSYDYGLGHEVSIKVVEKSAVDNVVEIKSVADSAITFRTIHNELDTVTRTEIEGIARSRIYERYPKLNPTSAYFNMLLNVEMIEIYKNRKANDLKLVKSK